MNIREIKEVLPGCNVKGPQDTEIREIFHDSRKIAPGSKAVMFAAVPGLNVDGHSFVKEAVERGASSLLVERPSEADLEAAGVTEVIVADVREALSALAARLYGDPALSMTIVGVTGTNGKTTTTYLLESIFKESGFCSGVIGTVNYRYGGKTFSAPHTTPEAPELQRMLREMKDAGVTHCAMEVSSHALTQKRVNGCRFDAALFTNLTHEHLDYHNTMEQYFEAKSLLFSLLKEGTGMAVINADDEWAMKIPAEKRLDYSLKTGADVHPLGHKLTAEGIEALVITPVGTIAVSSRLVGEYNLRNILAAVAAACAIGLDPRSIERGIAALERVPGRLEKITAGGPGDPPFFNAYVDYAHTPDALERTLRALGEITGGRIITVFGCGGNRDREKRPLMGASATALSDITVITSDNPRDEDPLEIISDIESGIKGVRKFDPGEITIEKLDEGRKCYMVIPDRGEAIKKAVSMARPGDTVLLAGKGHEDYQIVAGKKLYFEDSRALGDAITSMSGY
ncbi:MAG: UDP-N-acetylmuramoyl-L-alanyl-D-glutamate--2,6-diaminopimelate ligase [Thermodesulfobacteriota bacterium]|nr:MAG: UDP-N-acetylmuramoyl-L-alanyl-D-glutamate--2,6-diaminopimelate ligase [Thermodesulfobacteriota bacterium]